VNLVWAGEPGLQMVAADWWNPQSWIQSIGSLIGDAAGAATAIPRAVGGLLTVLQGLLRLFTDTGHFVQDAVGWLTNALFPPELQTWFLGTIGAPGKQWDPTQIYQGVYQSMQAPALLVAGAGAASRLVQTTLDHRISGAHAVFAVLPRFLLAVLIIGIPGTDVSLGYLVPRSRRNREHPLTKRYLEAVTKRVCSVVPLPDESERVRYAVMEGIPAQDVSPSLKAAYRRLTASIASAPARQPS